MMKRNIVAILHNIRSSHNVGSMFRSADAAGALHIYLSGYTPLPVDRFGRENKAMSKTALGAEGIVPWTRVADLSSLIESLQAKGVQVVGLERTKGSEHYLRIAYRSSVALLVGNEVRGLSAQTLKRVDAIAEIPMLGTKESLNVGVAFGVALYGIRSVR